MTESYRDESRKNYRSDRNINATCEQINTGSLQRIADATEAMAKYHVRLQRERDQFEQMWREASRARDSLRRRNSALRGVITRLKNTIADYKNA